MWKAPSSIFYNLIVVFHQGVKFHCLMKILINGVRGVFGHTFFPTPFSYQGTVNTSLRHKFGIYRCPRPGEQVRKRCPQQHVLLYLVFQVLNSADSPNSP